ncbi:hypothetical protein GLA29479_3450 [Lysobacter antibioticus]|nr:hypothetical protein GLA29479_3450 [Lysobacter antibioticus]
MRAARASKLRRGSWPRPRAQGQPGTIAARDLPARSAIAIYFSSNLR